MSTGASLRARLVGIARELVAGVEGQPAAPITVTIQSAAGTVLSITVAAGELEPEATPRLRRMERKILEQLTSSPIPAKTAITRAGYRVNSTSRAAVTRLYELGLAVRAGEGIRKA